MRITRGPRDAAGARVPGVALQHATSPGEAAALFRSPEARLALVRAAWPHAVGPELARRTRVLGVDGAVLRVQVPDARWRKVLHRMQPTILGRIARVAGEAAPRRIGFIEAPIDEAGHGATEGAVTAVPLGPPVAVERSATAIDDPELRRLFLETATRYLGHARGRSSDDRS